MQRVSAVPVLAAIAALSLLIFLPACGGGGNGTSPVSQIVITPSVSSLNQGDIAALTATPEDSTGTAVAADLTFSSSNSTIGAISPGGLVCGGSWDASYINCTPTQGAGGVGQVTITATATASGIKATATVYVHEVVSQINVFVQTPCTSMGQQVKLYAQVLNTTAPGCSSSAPCDITSTVGPITFGSNNSGIVSVTSAGQLMAGNPGATTVFASVSGVNSVGTPYMTCPVATILVHDASSSNTSFTIGLGGTQALTADVYDTNNQYIKPTLTWGSSSTAVATVAASGTVNNPGTITGVAPGTAYITATCSYPNCNLFLPAQYSQNLVKTTVVGGTTTTVYAASTKSTMLVPFPISTDVPGTAITLPYTPNSIIADPAGAAIYLGSSKALMVYTISTGAVTTFAAPGAIQAISPDGTRLLLSDTTGGNLNYYDISTSSITSNQTLLTVTSDAYTPDSGFNEWVTGTTYGFGSSSGQSGALTLANTGNAVDIMAQGGFTYITSPSTSSGAGQVYVYWTCNQLLNQTLTATDPTLIKALPNGTGAAAADSPNLDLISTPSTLIEGCPLTPGESPSTLTPYDLGAGAFTATQMFMSPDSSRVWILSNLPQVLNFDLAELAPNNVSLAGGAVPLYGGMTLDSAHAYVGTSDGTVHRIDTSSMTDVAQIAVGLKDSSGNVTPPNLVSVLP
jgi:hypothetical protein